MTQIAILALPGCLHSAVSGVIDVLTLANALNGSPLLFPEIVTHDGEPVESYSKIPVRPERRLADATPDIILLPPIFNSLDQALAMEAVIRRLSEHRAAGGTVATACAGSFLLAETGALDGREATTHWSLAEEFRQRYPAVRLRERRMLIDGGDYVCAGGVTACMDLALHLVNRYAGGEIARQCAKFMLLDPHRELQTPYGTGGFRRDHGDAAILRVQLWLDEHYAEPIRISDMAGQAILSERTFLRRFQAATGEPPARYLKQLRVEAARTLLETTPLGVEGVAEAVGYTDSGTFRKVFKRIMGYSPSTHRKRFSLDAASGKRSCGS